jgi:hypothetical protein
MLEFDRLTRAYDSMAGPESNLYLTEDDQRVYAQYPTRERAGHNAYIASGVLNSLGFTSTKLQLVDNGMVALDAPSRPPGLFVRDGGKVSRLDAKSITAAAWIGMESVFYDADSAFTIRDESTSPFDDSYDPGYSQVYLESLFKTFDTGIQGAGVQYEGTSVPLYNNFLSPTNRTLTGKVYKGVSDSVIKEAVGMLDRFTAVPREALIKESGLNGEEERTNNMRDNLLHMKRELP